MSNPNVEPTEILTIDEAVRRFRAAILDWKVKRNLADAAQRTHTDALKASEAAHDVMMDAEGNLCQAARLKEPPIDWPDWSRHIDG